jgi:hypothetical protein
VRTGDTDGDEGRCVARPRDALRWLSAHAPCGVGFRFELSEPKTTARERPDAENRGGLDAERRPEHVARARAETDREHGDEQ